MSFLFEERSDILKKLKSYTNIWSVEKVIYAINDFKLPFPITFSQMAWFVCILFSVMLLADLPPLSLIQGALLKYIGVPVGLTWFMSQKTFDGKKPYRFIQTTISYFFRPKITFAGKTINLNKEKMSHSSTIVRSEVIEIPH